VNVNLFLDHLKQKFIRMLKDICRDTSVKKDLIVLKDIWELLEVIIDIPDMMSN
jgi:hypothetical protein